MTDPISRRLLAAAVDARLRAEIAGVTGYRTEAVDVPIVANSNGRAAQYWVLTVSAGTPTDQQDLGDSVVDLDWLIQVTAAAGDEDDVLELVQRIDAALHRWAPTVSDLVCGPLRPPPGYDALLQLDRSVQPHRPFVPLQYGSRNTAT